MHCGLQGTKAEQYKQKHFQGQDSELEAALGRQKQGCALARPGGPWHPTFAYGFSYKSHAWHPRVDRTGSEHWAPFNFP